MFLVSYDYRAYVVTCLVEKESQVAGAKRKIKESILGDLDFEIYEDSFSVTKLEFGKVDWL